MHQGSVLSPLLFIIVPEAPSLEFRTGCPWELLYADDMVAIAGSLEDVILSVTQKLDIKKVILMAEGWGKV